MKVPIIFGPAPRKDDLPLGANRTITLTPTTLTLATQRLWYPVWIWMLGMGLFGLVMLAMQWVPAWRVPMLGLWVTGGFLLFCVLALRLLPRAKLQQMNWPRSAIQNLQQHGTRIEFDVRDTDGKACHGQLTATTHAEADRLFTALLTPGSELPATPLARQETDQALAARLRFSPRRDRLLLTWRGIELVGLGEMTTLGKGLTLFGFVLMVLVGSFRHAFPLLAPMFNLLATAIMVTGMSVWLQGRTLVLLWPDIVGINQSGDEVNLDYSAGNLTGRIFLTVDSPTTAAQLAARLSARHSDDFPPVDVIFWSAQPPPVLGFQTIGLLCMNKETLYSTKNFGSSALPASGTVGQA